MLEFFKLIPIIIMIIFICLGIGVFLLINKIFKWRIYLSFDLTFIMNKVISY